MSSVKRKHDGTGSSCTKREKTVTRDATTTYGEFNMKDISSKTVPEFRKFLFDCEENAWKPIVYINSCGGSVTASLQIYDLMQCSKLSITTIVETKALSAAVLVAAAGDVRIASKYAEYLVHSTNGSETYASVDEFTLRLKQITRNDQKWNEALSNVCSLSVQTLFDMATYEGVTFSSEYAMNYGLVDKIGISYDCI